MFAYRMVLMIMFFLRIFAGIRKFLLHPRLQLVFFVLLAFALQGAIWLFSPAQGPVVLYKLGLAVIAVVLAVICDIAIFPYARPDSYLEKDWRYNLPSESGTDGQPDFPVIAECEGPFCISCLRRALIIAAFVLAVSLGL
jgi:hypothetical protein